MLLKDVKPKEKFRFLIDLEPGETIEMLPVYQKLIIDYKIKCALDPKFLQENALCILNGCVTPVKNDTDVEVIH